MSKIDKTDIENIKIITKETKLKHLSRIKIRKGDYEIELSSESSNVVAPVSENISASNINITEEKITSEVIKDEIREKFDELIRSQGYVSKEEFEALESIAKRLESRLDELEAKTK